MRRYFKNKCKFQKSNRNTFIFFLLQKDELSYDQFLKNLKIIDLNYIIIIYYLYLQAILYSTKAQVTEIEKK